MSATYPPAFAPPTYSASITGLITALTATDIASIGGSDSKTITITKIVITGNAGTAITSDVSIIKRSSANSGGTSSTATAVPYDSQDPAATAVVKSYTANPTIGTATGTIAGAKLVVPSVAGTFAAPLTFEWGKNLLSKPKILHGIAESLCVNLNGGTILSSSLNIFIEWSES